MLLAERYDIDLVATLLIFSSLDIDVVVELISEALPFILLREQ